MTPIAPAIEISRPPEEAFGYVTDPSRFAEWLIDALGGRMEKDGPPGVGTRYTTVRRPAGVVRTKTTSEITEMNTPRSWSARGTGWPLRETVKYTVVPLDGIARSRVRIELGFEGRGIGRLFVPLVVRRQARKEMPINCRKLKERLEGDS